MTGTITPARRNRLTTRVMLMTAAASITGVLGATAPASAANDGFVAVAIGGINDAPPVTVAGGLSVNADQNLAIQGALSDCVAKGAHQCVVQAVKQSGCAAAASNDFGEMVGATEITLRRAQDNAIGKLTNRQGARIVASGCSNGAVSPPAAPPAPAPKLGPTASLHPILGGLEAHITDRSGLTSQCTFAMDDINRSFGLPANSTTDLKIVPAIPRFRDRSVTITCDNGTKTQTTTRF